MKYNIEKGEVILCTVDVHIQFTDIKDIMTILIQIGFGLL